MRERSKRRGRQARTVGVSLFPEHISWIQEVVWPRTRLGVSGYIQRLVHADMRSGGRVLAQAILADHE